MQIRRVAATVEQRKLRVAAYCRVSTKHAEQEDSLEIQQSTYERYIHSNSAWEFAGLYADARSGLNAEKREGFMRMIEDAMDGKIDLILCKSISRFSRNIVECQRYTELLRSRNVTVVFEKEHIRTDEPTSSLIFSLMCAIAQDESRSISENILLANKHRVEVGIYTPRRNHMLGYDVQEGKLVADAHAWIIRYIFEQYAAGAGIMDICRGLNKQGAKCKISKNGFGASTIQRILENENYVGDKRLQKQVPHNCLTGRPDPTIPHATNYLTDDHEAIIDRKTWADVQARLKREAIARENGVRRQGNSHALYGRIFCKSCGQPYMRRVFRRKAAPSEQYYVWCCRGRVSGSECRNPNIREDVLMKLVSAEGSYMVESSGAVVEKNYSAVHNKSF